MPGAAGHQASVLKRAADDFRIPIVVTNQVTANMDSAHPQAPGHAGDETVVAALGTLWAHAVNVRLVLEVQNNLRLLTVRSKLQSKSMTTAGSAFCLWHG